MLKKEYLQALKEALGSLTEEDKEAALRFCEEMLDDRMESGMTEEEAVAAMEPAGQLAEKWMKEMRNPSPAAPAAQTPRPEFGEWQRMQLKCDAARLNHIDLQAGNMGIKVLPCADDQVTLTYFTRPKNVYEAKVEGDTLFLREMKGESQRSFMNFFVNIGGPKLEITLTVPVDMMVNLKAVTKNGGVSLSGLQMLMHVEMGTTNGGMAVENIKCISVDAHTTNGGIAVAQAEAKQLFSFRTTNGGVAVKDCLSGGDMTLRTTNGGVTVRNLRSEKELSVSSTNGGIKVEQLDGSSIRLHTTNSSISGTIRGPREIWQIDSHTTNGRNSLPTFQNGQKPLSVHTTNSPIHISFD